MAVQSSSGVSFPSGAHVTQFSLSAQAHFLLHPTFTSMVLIPKILPKSEEDPTGNISLKFFQMNYISSFLALEWNPQ